MANSSKGTERIPKSALPYFEKTWAIVEKFCLEHLDEEYKDLAFKLTVKLARKRPSPLMRGDLKNWAGGILYALGMVNFLFEPSRAAYKS